MQGLKSCLDCSKGVRDLNRQFGALESMAGGLLGFRRPKILKSSFQLKPRAAYFREANRAASTYWVGRVVEQFVDLGGHRMIGPPSLAETG